MEKKPEKAAGASDCVASSALRGWGGKKTWVKHPRLSLSKQVLAELWGRFGGFGVAGCLWATEGHPRSSLSSGMCLPYNPRPGSVIGAGAAHRGMDFMQMKGWISEHWWISGCSLITFATWYWGSTGCSHTMGAVLSDLQLCDIQDDFTSRLSAKRSAHLTVPCTPLAGPLGSRVEGNI